MGNIATYPGQLYIASSLHNITRVQHLMRRFAGLGVGVTYDWTKHGQFAYPECVQVAPLELAGALAARCLLLVMPARNGSHFEAGAAYIQRIPIVILCEDPALLTTSFHHLPQLIRCDTEETAIAAVLSVLDGTVRPYEE